MTDLNSRYQFRYENFLKPAAIALEEFLCDLYAHLPRIDQISARAKSIDRFISKAERQEYGTQKYTDPLAQIQDQLGARIVTFYPDDVRDLDQDINRYFRPIESQTHVPDSDSEFAYFGHHYVLILPDEIEGIVGNEGPSFFELQIQTLFQHAWSEANHDLGYKPSSVLDKETVRLIALASAQAWGADRIFNELHRKFATN